MSVALHPRQHPNAAWREVEGEVVIISPEDSVLHELNATASFIWKRATGQPSVEEIALQLAEEFEVEEAVALADARELVQQLMEKQLMVTAEAAR